MTLARRIHYCSVEEVALETGQELVIESKPKKVFNPIFVLGCLLFIGGMILKANVIEKWAAIPLAIAAFILFTGVWILSANAKLVFDCYEHKVFIIYSHLGYLRKIYTIPMLSIERMEVKQARGINKLYLVRDNGEKILVSNIKSLTEMKADGICTNVNDFLLKNR